MAADPALVGASLTDGARRALISAADGDARVALNTLELAAAAATSSSAAIGNAMIGGTSGSDAGSGSSSAVGRAGAAWEVDEASVLAALQRRATYYDRNGEFHYDLISALHKSMRGGDADGALYYCCRMLAGGEEPRYVTRRLIRFASEDVGLADPLALQQAVTADQAVHAIGM